jgi:hypothetical protein
MMSRKTVLSRAMAIVAFLLLGGLLAACQQQAASPAPPANNFRPRASIAEVMESVVVPSADVLWNATAYDISAEGVKDFSPKTDEDWERVEWAGVTLAEGLNALLIPGRRVAPPGTVSESPEHELNPEQIEEILKREPEVWVGFVHALDDTVQEIQEAIRKRDLKALNEAGGALDEVCENCHLHFWYPNDNKKK